MLWLLPPEAGPVRVRLNPGAYVVPRWYDHAELGVLLEVLRRALEPGVTHAAVLPVDALGTERWTKASLGEPVLIAVEGELYEERRSELGRWAREHRHHVLVRARADEDELSTGWLERWVKPAVVWLLERGAWAQGHPLDAFGIEGLTPDEVARVSEDPVEVLWLVERMLRHRLRYAEQGIAEGDYARSLRHAVGERCGERLRRHGEGVTAGLDVIVGGAQSKEGWAALVRAGLGAWREGVFARGPLLRVVEADWAVVEVIVGELGEEVLSAEAKEVVHAKRRTVAPRFESKFEVLPADAISLTFDHGLLAAALRDGLRELDDAPPLLGEVVEAVEHWERMRWNPEALERLRNLRPRLKAIQSLPSAAHRWFLKIENQALALLTARNPADARRSRNALRRLLGNPLEGWELNVWLNATLECARIHRDRAESAEDIEHGTKQLTEITRPTTSPPWHAAEALRLLAELAAIRESYDIAIRILQQNVVPAFEQLNDTQSLAMARNQIARILHAQGDTDEALHIYQEHTLPIFERLGDERLIATTKGQIADILEAKGDIDQALHIRRHYEVPTYERLGDERSRAMAMGKIAGILQAKGDLDHALKVRLHDEIPVYERLGDIRMRAITSGEIADIFEAKGDIDTALRIRQREELPIYERLGDRRLQAGALARIAVLCLERNDPEARRDAARMLSEAYQIYTDLGLPVANAVRKFASSRGLVFDSE